jgi:hypothetical protein
MSEVQERFELAKVVLTLGTGDTSLEVVVNRGEHDGLRQGQRFLVFGYGPEITDPDSGKNLGRVELVRGRGEVVHVQPHLATLRSVEKSREGGKKRIIRDTSGLGIFAGRGHVVEEDVGEERAIPFLGVQVGDMAKPI